jgi:Fe-S-cluster containining protein
MQQVYYYMTTGLMGLMAQARARMTPQRFLMFQTEIVDGIEFYKNQLLRAPAGPVRARAGNQLIDDLIERSRKAPKGPEYWAQATCRAGCAHCCHTTVRVSGDEADLLVEKITNGEAQIDMALLERQAAFQGDELAWWRQPHAEKKCVFLGADNRCTVYEDRPVSCRKYYVASEPEQCADVDGTRQAMILAEFDTEIAATATADIDKNQDSLPLSIWKRLMKK